MKEKTCIPHNSPMKQVWLTSVETVQRRVVMAQMVTRYSDPSIKCSCGGPVLLCKCTWRACRKTRRTRRDLAYVRGGTGESYTRRHLATQTYNFTEMPHHSLPTCPKFLQRYSSSSKIFAHNETPCKATYTKSEAPLLIDDLGSEVPNRG